MDRLTNEIRFELGVEVSDVIEIDTRALGVAQPFSLDLAIDGRVRTVQMAPHSVRSDTYQLIEMRGDQRIEHQPGPVRTLRGFLVDDPSIEVAGSLLDDGLHLMIMTEEPTWIQPVPANVAAALPGDHMQYRSGDVDPHGGACGNEHVLDVADVEPIGGGVGGGAGLICAELACDADVEYFNTYGTVAATEAQINSIINAVNLQYNAEVGINHVVTAIVVRSTNPDPYTQTDSFGRLAISSPSGRTTRAASSATWPTCSPASTLMARPSAAPPTSASPVSA